MIVGVPRETFPGERRVALVPIAAAKLMRAGFEIMVENDAGLAAGFADREYAQAGATIGMRPEVFERAGIIAQVRTFGANPAAGRSDLELMRPDQMIVGFAEPLTALAETRAIAERGAQLLALELLPRITRAQSMDALSSQATISGYKAVLLAADALPRMFPLLMTAAGTVSPARVFVIGAGVAGLTAIATAHRLGAVVRAYDLRPAVKEQVESLGAAFVEIGVETSDTEDAGGYAKTQSDEFYRRQREMLARVVASSEVVITAAAVPGQPAPMLITGAMISEMPPGAVVVDVAAERGGNCEITRAGQTFVHAGITIMGPLNLPATVPYHASLMYANNVTALLQHLHEGGRLSGDADTKIDTADEIAAGVLVTRGGEIVHPRVRALLGESAALPT